MGHGGAAPEENGGCAMSVVVVVPGLFHGQPHPVGKLASTLLSVAVAGMADPARFRRGKAYVADKAVTRLEVSPGRLVANVLGSRASPYQVIVAVSTVDRPLLGSPEAFRQNINQLTPEADEFSVSCTCPDWDDPCKHAVAALLAFANELVVRPELLVAWRCHEGGGAGQRAKVGSRARPRPAPVRAPAPARTPWESDEWRAFLGAAPPPLPAVPHETAAVGAATLGALDLAAWLGEAIERLTADGPLH